MIFTARGRRCRVLVVEIQGGIEFTYLCKWVDVDQCWEIFEGPL